MTIALDSYLVSRLIKSFGGVTKLLRHWEETFGVEEAPNRQTVYNWQDGRLPRTSINLIRLAQLLDVDPFCLLAPRDATTADAISDVLEAYQLDTSAEPGLQFVRAFFGWKRLWPPPYWEELRKKRHGPRQDFEWHEHEFRHNARTINYYPTIALSSHPELISARPQTFHFAYSGRGALKTRWLQYGFVVRHERSATLTHIHGHTDTCHTPDAAAPTLVGTWFGPGPARFRVASQHPFALEAMLRCDEDEDRVCFPG